MSDWYTLDSHITKQNGYHFVHYDVNFMEQNASNRKVGKCLRHSCSGWAFWKLATSCWNYFRQICSRLWNASGSSMPGTHIFQRCVVSRNVWNVPEMSAHMQKRGFVVRRSDKNFNSVSTDQALEQNINREAKSKGGVIGCTLRKGALLRWLLTRHVTGEYAERFNDICSWAKPKKLHEELGDLG